MVTSALVAIRLEGQQFIDYDMAFWRVALDNCSPLAVPWLNSPIGPRTTLEFQSRRLLVCCP